MKLAILSALVAATTTANAAHATRCGVFCDLYLMGCDAQVASPPNGTWSYTANGGQTARENCIDECASFPDGGAADTYDPATDDVISTGNTFECRHYHAYVANLTAANAETHCAHANPASINNDISTGPCSAATGDDRPECENYCDNWDKACTGWMYTSKDMCLSTCNNVWNDIQTDAPSQRRSQFAVASGDNLSCRRYHLDVAFGHPRNNTGTSAQSTHCPHATLGDGVCGDTCSNYCYAVQKACATYDIWTSDYNSSRTTCIDSCATFGSAAPAEKMSASIWDWQNTEDLDNVECRNYHAHVAAFSAPEVHCEHARSMSTVCLEGYKGSSGSFLAPATGLIAALIVATQL